MFNARTAANFLDVALPQFVLLVIAYIKLIIKSSINSRNMYAISTFFLVTPLFIPMGLRRYHITRALRQLKIIHDCCP
jgi:hypothetical protein